MAEQAKRTMKSARDEMEMPDEAEYGHEQALEQIKFLEDLLEISGISSILRIFRDF